MDKLALAKRLLNPILHGLFLHPILHREGGELFSTPLPPLCNFLRRACKTKIFG